MSKPKSKHYSKPQPAKGRGGLFSLFSLLKSSGQLIILSFVPLAMLFLAVQMHETQLSQNEPVSFLEVDATPLASLPSIEPDQLGQDLQKRQVTVSQPNDLTLNLSNNNDDLVDISTPSRPTDESQDKLNTISDTPEFIEELIEEGTTRVHPFDMAAQTSQAQAIGQALLGSSPTDFGFTGQRHENFGLLDYGGRYYNPVTGRFISADSIVPEPGNPQALNRYSYVYNNPIKYTDPSGHCVWDACIVEGAIIGAGLVMAVDYSVQVNNNLNNGMSFGDAVYYKNINTQELGGATLLGAGGGGITAWAAPAVAPYAYYAADKANTFFQTPAGRATGNFLQGAGQACTENCDPGNVIAGGLQDIMMGGLAGDYSTGTAFSGAFDPITGNIGVRPSSNDINNIPPGWVYRSGGHAVLANDLGEVYGSNFNDLYGYTISYDAPGELSILSWRSGTLNRQHGDIEPPPNVQAQIIDALKQKTGWNVTAP